MRDGDEASEAPPRWIALVSVCCTASPYASKYDLRQIVSLTATIPRGTDTAESASVAAIVDSFNLTVGTTCASRDAGGGALRESERP